MPTMTDTSTLDVVVVEGWHVDTIDGTTRQKLINIHVDDWWMGVEIRVPVRLIVPLQGSVDGFIIGGSGGSGEGDQPWKYYNKGYRSNAAFLDLALAVGWSEAEIQASRDSVADDLYVSENWDQLAARGVDYFSLPGSHDWVAYDVPSTSTILPDLRTYIVPNGGHDRPGHPEAPDNSVNAAFFAEQLFEADGGLEPPRSTAAPSM